MAYSYFQTVMLRPGFPLECSLPVCPSGYAAGYNKILRDMVLVRSSSSHLGVVQAPRRGGMGGVEAQCLYRAACVARSSPFEDLSVYLSLFTLDFFTVVNFQCLYACAWAQFMQA